MSSICCEHLRQRASRSSNLEMLRKIGVPEHWSQSLKNTYERVHLLACNLTKMNSSIGIFQGFDASCGTPVLFLEKIPVEECHF